MSLCVGVLLSMTHHKYNLFEVHNRLMALNVTLRSMLDVEEAAYHEMVSMSPASPITITYQVLLQNERISSGIISASPSANELVDTIDAVLPSTDNLSSPERNTSALSFEPPPPVLSDFSDGEMPDDCEV